jgi:hypothetical protein
MGEFALPWTWLGRVGGEAVNVRRGGETVLSVPLNELDHAWRHGFERHVA